MKNPKNDTTKLIYKTETYSQCWIMNLWLPQGEKWEVRNILVFRDWHVHTAILKIDNQKDSSCITLKNCCCSVAKSCLILCDSKDSSMSGFPVLHYLPEFAWLMSIESIMPSNHLILCRPLRLLSSIFPSIRFFPMSQFFASGGQSIGSSASASVLPMNIQDWFPLGLTGLISLQSKGLSRIFSNTHFKSVNSSTVSFLYGLILTSFDLCWQNNVVVF